MARAEKGVALAGLTTMVQPAARAGPALRVIMAMREVPGRDRGAHAHGLLQHQDPARGHGLRDDVAIDPLGFLREPLEERGAVGDLALGLGQRLALLAGHQEGEVVGVGHDQLEPAAQDRRPLLGGLGPPGRQRPLGGLDRPARLGHADAGHGADGLAVGRVGDLDGLAVVGVDPRAVDVALLAEQALVGELDARILECGRHGALVLAGWGRAARGPDRCVAASIDPAAAPAN